MPKNTYYLFDESIAPLTEEEEKIMEEYRILQSKVDKIYQRTDKVIKLHNKKEKDKEIKRKRQDEEERIQLCKKQKEEELRLKQELLEKIKCFPENYIQFTKEFYKLFDELRILRSNFEDTRDKLEEINNLRRAFRDKCVHPDTLKTDGWYNYEVSDGGGSGFGSSKYQLTKCDGCILCGYGR